MGRMNWEQLPLEARVFLSMVERWGMGMLLQQEDTNGLTAKWNMSPKDVVDRAYLITRETFAILPEFYLSADEQRLDNDLADLLADMNDWSKTRADITQKLQDILLRRAK